MQDVETCPLQYVQHVLLTSCLLRLKLRAETLHTCLL